MNNAVKDRWLKALRSGEFPQSRNSLHRVEASADIPAGFCCLGVLCEIAVQDEVVTKELHEFGVAETYGDGHVAFLPEEVVSWAGLSAFSDSDQGPTFRLREVDDLLTEEEFHIVRQMSLSHVTVVDLNDNGVSFDTIAKVIERIF